MTNTVENFESMLLELCDLCSQNKQSLLGKIGMKQARLVEMFKERANITLNQSSNGWVNVDDVLPYSRPVFSIDDYPDDSCLLQIVTKDNLLLTAVFLEMKIPHYFHGEKLFWLCSVEILNGKFVIHEMIDDPLEIDEVKYWQPLPQPPKE